MGAIGIGDPFPLFCYGYCITCTTIIFFQRHVLDYDILITKGSKHIEACIASEKNDIIIADGDGWQEVLRNMYSINTIDTSRCIIDDHVM